jgi:hypothetical protein
MRERADTMRDESREEMDDLELLTRMLNGQLDAARVAIVRKRLEDDPAFRDFAAPLLLTWSVPPHRERFPLPEGAWEHAWERLQQRIRIEIPATPPVPAPKRSRIGRFFEISFWSVMIYVVILSLGAVLWYDLIKPNWFPDPTDGYVAPSGVVAPPTSPR